MDAFDPAGLAELIGPGLRLSSDSILVAESFSGPLAIELAARYKIAKLVVCNSFVCAPYPSVLKAVIWSALFEARLPRWLVRRYLVGRSAPERLVERVCEVVASVPAKVVARRLRAVLRVDVRRSLARCKATIQYLRGTDDRLIRERDVRAFVSSARASVDVSRIAGPHLLLQIEPERAWRAIESGSSSLGNNHGDAS